jgi:Family of unknown function (DUF6338)
MIRFRETELVPTTLTGLLLFVVLLLPGFAYLVGKERHGTERRLSPFRETVAIVAASITSELVVLAVFFAIRALWPPITPNVGALIDNTGAYLRGTPGHPGHHRIVAVWGVILLIAAALGAYLATKPKVRRVAEKLTGPYPHESTVSAWWVLFERWPNGRDVEVVCMLDDGSVVRGRFGSFNTSAEDSPDRDLILRRPIFYKPPVANALEVPYNVSAACFPARRVVTLFVAYNEPNRANPIRSLEQPGPATQEQLELGTAASPAQPEASTSVAEPILALEQSSTPPVPSGLSALRQRLRVLRFW